jgi:DNA-binding transcriptional ArsR family regulator
MLRIHFSGPDLGRLRLAPNADPLWEAVLSQHVLTDRAAHQRFAGWRGKAMARLTPQMRAIMRLAPPRGYTADFLTPTQGGGSLEAGLDLLRTKPPEQLRADLDLVAEQGALPVWTRRLADGDKQALRTLIGGMRRYFEATVAAFWDLIRGEVAAERAVRARIVADRGGEWMLATLHPTVRWKPPVLHVLYPHDRDIHLNGRGLTLLPSFFCRHSPITLRVFDGEPILVYPIDPALRPRADETPEPRRELVALLGQTRASVLRAVSGSVYGCTTGELAQRLGISLSSASEHAMTLRRAGLLASRTSGKQVIHIMGALGRALLDEND